MKKPAAFFLALLAVLSFVGCRQDAPGGEILVGSAYDLGGATQIRLVNGHNGYSSIITDANDIAEITAFVGDTVGKSLGSGKGYYEGSYSVTFCYDAGEEFLLAYGDDAVFYMGIGDDGYPVRYRLIHYGITEDVIPFFSRYDQSGMVWEESQ